MVCEKCPQLFIFTATGKLW